jgi:hypothetical protein
MQTKTTFIVALLYLLKFLKLYPYTYFDPRIISAKKKTPDDDSRIETRVAV